MTPDIIAYSQTVLVIMLLPAMGLGLMLLVSGGFSFFETFVAPYIERIQENKRIQMNLLKADCKLPPHLTEKPVHLCSHATTCHVFQTKACVLTHAAS